MKFISIVVTLMVVACGSDESSVSPPDAVEPEPIVEVGPELVVEPEPEIVEPEPVEVEPEPIVEPEIDTNFTVAWSESGLIEHLGTIEVLGEQVNVSLTEKFNKNTYINFYVVWLRIDPPCDWVPGEDYLWSLPSILATMEGKEASIEGIPIGVLKRGTTGRLYCQDEDGNWDYDVPYFNVEVLASTVDKGTGLSIIDKIEVNP